MNFSFRLTLYHEHLMRENLMKELIANCEKTLSPQNLTRRPKLSHSNFFFRFSPFLIHLRARVRFIPPKEDIAQILNGQCGNIF